MKSTAGVDMYKTIKFADGEKCQFVEVCVFPFICMKARE